MPTRTLDYLLMGIVAGVFAGIILVYVVGVTYLELLRVAESIRDTLKSPQKAVLINFIQLISKL